jgi:plasmid maintenance system antidote protein VapI
MYANLLAEIARKGWNKKVLAKTLKWRYATLIDKLNGKYPLTLEEALKIKDTLGTDLPVETLFLNNNTKYHTFIKR